ATPSHPALLYKAVWLIFFMLGLGTLLPWNFFMTATRYFTNRLDETQNMSLVTAENSKHFQPSATPTVPSPERNYLSALFNNVMTLCAMLPLLFFTCLNSFLHQRIPQSVRILGSLIAILLVFLITAVLVKVDLDAMPFFVITMIKIMLINCKQGWEQGSLFGLAGLLPTSYTAPIMSGQAWQASSPRCCWGKGTGLSESAFGYFITACGVIVLAIICYLGLNSTRYYQQLKLEGPGEQETKLDLISKGAYFIPVSCFLTFNVFDWLGRSLTAIFTWPGKDSHWLPSLVLARILFVPLLLLCNVQPRQYLAVVFEHDAWFIIFMAAFAFSNGYLASLCMCFGPKKVKPAEAETAGAIMAFFLSLGLALGAVFSFLFRSIV
uniref:Solute carrier family 29 member 1 (Augustine blood group) n=1 Tax=Lynx canadensis TaxID=61383 RepID=A0A667FWI7_LYNCA